MDITDYDEIYSLYKESSEKVEHYGGELFDIQQEADLEKEAIETAQENLSVLRSRYADAMQSKREAENEKEEMQGILNELESLEN